MIMQNKTKIEMKARIQVSIVKLKKILYVISIMIIEDHDKLELLYVSKKAQIHKFALQSSYILYD